MIWYYGMIWFDYWMKYIRLCNPDCLDICGSCSCSSIWLFGRFLSCHLSSGMTRYEGITHCCGKLYYNCLIDWWSLWCFRSHSLNAVMKLYDTNMIILECYIVWKCLKQKITRPETTLIHWCVESWCIYSWIMDHESMN